MSGWRSKQLPLGWISLNWTSVGQSVFAPLAPDLIASHGKSPVWEEHEGSKGARVPVLTFAGKGISWLNSLLTLTPWKSSLWRDFPKLALSQTLTLLAFPGFWKALTGPPPFPLQQMNRRNVCQELLLCPPRTNLTGTRARHAELARDGPIQLGPRGP